MKSKTLVILSEAKDLLFFWLLTPFFCLLAE